MGRNQRERILNRRLTRTEKRLKTAGVEAMREEARQYLDGLNPVARFFLVRIVRLKGAK